MKKVSLMFVGALLAWQTGAMAQTTTPKKTRTKTKTSATGDTTKTDQKASKDNQNGHQYSTSDRSGLNSYPSATDSTALSKVTGNPSDTTGKALKPKKRMKKSKP